MNEVSFRKWKQQMVGFSKVTRTPICATFELTPRCNLDCKMCYVHNQDSNGLREKELTTETWKRIFDEAYDSGMLFATLTGGECLLRQDFKELYLHLWNKRVYITVLTNGILLNEDYIEFLKTYKPRMIQISLYGSNEACYLKVTGHRGFTQVVTAIQRLRDEGINIEVALTPSSYMKDDYIALLRYCKENGFRYKPGEFMLMGNRENVEKADHYIEIDEIVKLSKERALLSKELMPMKEKVPESGGGCTVSPKGLQCNAGKTSAVVSWDGRMFPCIAIPESQASVLEMPYAEAWEKTKGLSDEIQLGAECVGCPYDKVCPKCPAIRLSSLHSGHCNPNVCEVTRKLVAAGVKKLETAKETHCDE